ncbi:PRTRC system ThiF family protein [Chitinophaga japonensis]|uniref:PRTRC genetic system ThiF family protein n=1 Tax=Chitinophaga japonensis TaxID=104662 RepID=A0A562T470_CHIJA|nr:PRTRC system ThiF family protein [Chitinophaga japonensis]TWI87810.1 PRTRC genetic system ThiF family protein [Chitinophaga japonensis]
MKQPLHFMDNSFINPTNPISINIIGAGGTGSHMIAAIARLNHTLIALGHPGFTVQLWDDDTVSETNVGRQLFADSEIGLPKSVCLINKVNRFFGTDWKAITQRFEKKTRTNILRENMASLTISCVDEVKPRFEIADLLLEQHIKMGHVLDSPTYWIDCGNSRYNGQVILATVGDVRQPDSKKYIPVAFLPMVTDEFKDSLLTQVDNREPSCSMAEALAQQSLFINSTLANLTGSLLEQAIRQGFLEYRGFFVDLLRFRALPIKITAHTDRMANAA